jgi:hypothetical protein
MKLSDEDIAEFQEVWKRAFGEDLDAGEARNIAHNLLELYAALARPLPSELASRFKQPPKEPDNPEFDSRNLH